MPEDAQKLQYVCIHCGNPVDSLYKQYSASVLKIIHCEKCTEVADKYIEYEPIMVIIDIVLLSREAYRHVLYNTFFKIRWKLAVILLLFESYIRSKEQQMQQQSVDYSHPLSSEQNFYFGFFLTVIDKLLLSVLLFGFAQATSHYYVIRDRPTCANIHKHFSNAFKCVTLSSVTKFFLLPAIIWHENTTVAGAVLHELLVRAYYTMALVQTFSVLASCSRGKACLVVAISLAVKTFLNYQAKELTTVWQ